MYLTYLSYSSEHFERLHTLFPFFQSCQLCHTISHIMLQHVLLPLETRIPISPKHLRSNGFLLPSQYSTQPCTQAKSHIKAPSPLPNNNRPIPPPNLPIHQLSSTSCSQKLHTSVSIKEQVIYRGCKAIFERGERQPLNTLLTLRC